MVCSSLLPTHSLPKGVSHHGWYFHCNAFRTPWSFPLPYSRALQQYRPPREGVFLRGQISEDRQLKHCVIGLPQAHIYPFPPPAPAQASESGLEGGQYSSNCQKARAFTSAKIKAWEGKGGESRQEKQEREREASEWSVPARGREEAKSISSTLCNLLIS